MTAMRSDRLAPRSDRGDEEDGDAKGRWSSSPPGICSRSLASRLLKGSSSSRDRARKRGRGKGRAVASGRRSQGGRPRLEPGQPTRSSSGPPVADRAAATPRSSSGRRRGEHALCGQIAYDWKTCRGCAGAAAPRPAAARGQQASARAISPASGARGRRPGEGWWLAAAAGASRVNTSPRPISSEAPSTAPGRVACSRRRVTEPEPSRRAGSTPKPPAAPLLDHRSADCPAS